MNVNERQLDSGSQMKSKTKLRVILSVIVSLFLALAPNLALAAPSNPTIDYEFENNLTDLGNASTITVAPACPANPCNTSTGFGTSSGDTYWEWTSTNARGGGFTIDTNQAIGSSYTIMLKFSFSQMSSYRKIIDFQNRGDDTGFYIYGGKINEYPLGTGANTYQPNQEITLMVTRDATSKLFTVYVYDGTNFNQELQVTDTNNRAIPIASPSISGGSRLGFFFDDLSTNGEATPSGKVFYIRMWQGTALAQADLQSLAATSVIAAPQPSQPNSPPSQTPSSAPQAEAPQLAETGSHGSEIAFLALVLLGLGTAMAWRKASRKATNSA